MSGMLLSGMLSTVLSGIIVLTAVHVAPPSIPPAETEGSTWAKQLDIKTGVLQETTPVQQLDLYLNGFHFVHDRPEVQEEAHHYCQQMNEEFAQYYALQGGETSATYQKDAEQGGDRESAQFCQEIHDSHRRMGERAKKLLKQRLDRSEAGRFESGRAARLHCTLREPEL